MFLIELVPWEFVVDVSLGADWGRRTGKACNSLEVGGIDNSHM